MPVVSGDTMTFADLRHGMTVRVKAIELDTPECRRLEEMGLTPGTSFRVVKIAPFGDPIEIDLRGYRLCLRKGETAGFVLEPAN
jgi:ferrous iron transport protein A